MNDAAEAWQTGFKVALYGFILKYGSAVRDDFKAYRSYGSWEDYYDSPDVANHLAECAFDLDECSYKDSDWVEFDGTFAEPSWGQRNGLDAWITCACGKVDHRHWRYHGTYQALMEGLTGKES